MLAPLCVRSWANDKNAWKLSNEIACALSSVSPGWCDAVNEPRTRTLAHETVVVTSQLAYSFSWIWISRESFQNTTGKAIQASDEVLDLLGSTASHADPNAIRLLHETASCTFSIPRFYHAPPLDSAVPAHLSLSFHMPLARTNTLC